MSKKRRSQFRLDKLKFLGNFEVISRETLDHPVFNQLKLGKVYQFYWDKSLNADGYRLTIFKEEKYIINLSCMVAAKQIMQEFGDCFKKVKRRIPSKVFIEDLE